VVADPVLLFPSVLFSFRKLFQHTERYVIATQNFLGRHVAVFDKLDERFAANSENCRGLWQAVQPTVETSPLHQQSSKPAFVPNSLPFDTIMSKSHGLHTPKLSFRLARDPGTIRSHNAHCARGASLA
jgi:hypothetical protein